MLVVFLHETSLVFSQQLLISRLGPFRYLLAPILRGEIGVGVLIFLSGYLLLPKYSHNNVGKKLFFIRRFSRIYPTYLFILILAISISRQWDFNGFLNAIFLLPNFPGTLWPYPYLSSAWSLGVEWTLYLAIPIFSLSNYWREKKLFGWLFLIYFFILIGHFQGTDMHTLVYGSVLGRSIEFLMGGFYFHKRMIFSGLSKKIKFTCIFSMLITVQGWSIWYLSARGASSNSYLRLLQPLIEPLAAILLLEGLNWIRRLKSQNLLGKSIIKFFVFIGEISYPLYLVHITCIDFAKNFIHNHFQYAFKLQICFITILSIILSVVVSYAIHILIELPGMKIGRSKPIFSNY